MYHVSENYINKTREPTRDVRITGTVTLIEGTIVNINEHDILSGSLSYSEHCISGSNLDIGSVYASEMLVTLTVPVEDPYKLDMARLSLQFGLLIESDTYEDVPLGHYYITDIQRERAGVVLKALDGMILLDEDIVDFQETGTPFALVSALALRCGVSLSTTSFEFSSFANNDVVLTVPETSSVKTYRDLLMWICQLTSTFARFDRLGGLELISVTNRNPVRTIGAVDRYDRKISDYTVEITKLEMQVGEILFSVGTEGMTMVLEENPLMSDMSEQQIGTILAGILVDVGSVSYVPAEIDHRGDPSLQPGDFILITDLEGDDVISYITNSSWTFRSDHKLVSKGESGLIKGNHSQQGKSLTSINVDVKKVTTEAKEARQVADNAMQSANEKNSIFRQPEAPAITGRKVGDTWFDTDDDNHIYTFNGSAWISAQLGSGAIAEGAIAKEQLETALKDELQATQDEVATRNRVYRQDEMPTGESYRFGDIWLNTSKGNAIYTFNGDSWEPAQLGSDAIGHGVIDADNIAQGAITADKILDGIISESKFNIKTHLLF